MFRAQKISFSENIKFQFQSILAQVLPPPPPPSMLLPFSPKPRINFRTRRFIVSPLSPSPLSFSKNISYIGEITSLKIKRKETEFGERTRNNSNAVSIL